MENMAKALVGLACHLRTIRNRLVPISRLPPELIGSVFKALVNTPKPGTLGAEFYTRLRIRYWSRAMLVCRDWRRAALSTTSLWSTIVVMQNKSLLPHSLSMLSFERSGSTPLTVICDSEDAATTSRLHAALAPHIARVQELYFSSASEEARGNAAFLCSHYAPELKTLQLLQSGGGDEDGRIPQHLLTKPRQTIMDESLAPKLQVLVLANLRAPQRAQLSSTLRVLCLIRMAFWIEADLTWFFATLSRLTGLEELVLMAIPDTYFGRRGDAIPITVSTPPLKRLSVEDQHWDAGFLSALRSRIHLPDDCAQQLYVRISSASLPLFLLEIYAQAERVFLGQARMIVLYGSSGRCIRWPPPTSARCLPGMILYDAQSHLLPTVFELWMAQDLDRCKFFPNITKLVIQADGNNGAYGSFPQRDPESDCEIFPALKDIQIIERKRLKPRSYESLLVFAKGRKEVGNPLETLQFILCQSKEKGPKALRARGEDLCSSWSDIVKHISYEIVEKIPTMEVPRSCSTPSDDHAFWKPVLWDSSRPFYKDL